MLGLDYWKGLQTFLNTMIEEKTIASKDLNLLLFTDSISDATDHIKKHSIDTFGLKKPRPIKVLGE